MEQPLEAILGTNHKPAFGVEIFSVLANESFPFRVETLVCWPLVFNAFQHSKITSWLRAVHTFLVASYTLSLSQVYFEPATLLNRAATTPGTSCPTLFRQVCGFFNVPQNFRVERIVRRDLRLIVLNGEDLKVEPFADVITKAALSPQLFKDPECWSSRSWTHDLPHDKPMLNQLSHRSLATNAE